MSTKIFLTSGTTWTVPSDWSNVNNTIEVIGAGGNGATNGGTSGGGGGGGGGYAKKTSLALTPGATITVAIGAPGSDTYFNGASLGAASLGCASGANGSGATGGTGSTGVGSGATTFKGGNGGSAGANHGGGGGGGAAGLNGAGAAGGDSGGNTGANGGTGDNGSGGAGSVTGVAGGNGTEYDGSHGSGGGAGGGSQGGPDPGVAGTYGAGGGGAAISRSSNNGANGLIVITYTPIGTDRYWVGTGNWDASTLTNWAATSGGGGGESIPGSGNNVHFDSNSSGSATITASASCANLDFTGYTHTISGSSSLAIYGSLTMVSGMTLVYTGAITFGSTSTGKTITTGTKTLISDITFNGSGGGWTLQDNMVAKSITLTAGTLNLGSVTVSLSSTGTIWNANGGFLSAGTSTIKFTDNSSSSKTFAGGGLTYNNLWITNAGSGAYTISGSNTFSDFKVDTPPHTINFTAGTLQTVATFTVNGTAGNLITLQSTSAGFPFYLKRSAGTISCDYLSVKDSFAS